MQQWVAVSIITILGVFLIVLLVILHTFGVYVKLLTKAHGENLDMRLNLVKQENSRAIDAIMHTHRRRTDPLPEQEKEA